MVVNRSSPCTLSTASFNVLQSSGTRIEVRAAVVVVEEEREEVDDDFVSPVDDAFVMFDDELDGEMVLI
jgi:hypothetical protein